MRWHTAFLVLLGTVGLAVAAAPTVGPGRVGIGGAFPTGYAAALGRYGLPREILYDAQLADARTLSTFGLLIVSGLPENDAIEAALRAYLGQGGRLLIDLSLQRLPEDGAGFSLKDNARFIDPTRLVSVAGLSRSGLRATGGSPITDDLQRLAEANANAGAEAGDETAARRLRLGLAPSLSAMTNQQVLAEYPAALSLAQAAALNRASRQAQPVGTSMSAIVVGDVGPGRMLVCGPLVGLGSAVLGINYDPLIIGLVRVLSEGRLMPQAQPDLLHVARRATVGDVEADPGAAADEPAAAGPAMSSVAPLPEGFVSLAEPAPDEYNLSGDLPDKDATVWLDWLAADCGLRLDLSAKRAALVELTGGQPRKEAALELAAGGARTFMVKRRVGTVLLRIGQQQAELALPDRAPGAMGWRGLVARPALQTVESPYFTDDFMRTSDQNGGWRTVAGEWETAPVENPEMGANPFSYKVNPSAKQAVALQGSPGWDEYSFSAAVRPGAEQTGLGLGWYASDERNMYRLWCGPHGAELQRVVDGQVTTLASDPTRLDAGQWYQIRVQSKGAKLTAQLDGRPWLEGVDRTFGGGGIALLAEGGPARFDDVLVEAGGIAATEGCELIGRPPRYAGLMDMDSWASPALSWVASPRAPGLFWRRGAFWGDLALSHRLDDLADGATSTLIIEADGEFADSGCSLEATRLADRLRLVLRRASRELGRIETAWNAASTLTIRRQGEALTASLDGEPLLQAKAAPTGGTGLGLLARGYLPRLSGLSLWAANLRNETFDSAPVNWWVGSGEWDVTNRWSCTPDWSWFGGVSDQVAAIWTKQPLAGDVDLHYWAGPKMLAAGLPDARGRQRFTERNGDFNAVICGDGKDPRRGYSAVVNPAKGGAYLLRNGLQVVANPSFRLFARAHNRWADLRLTRRGNVVCLYSDGQLICRFTDAQPLPGGYVGLWTQDNGLMTPRVTISYERLDSNLPPLG